MLACGFSFDLFLSFSLLYPSLFPYFFLLLLLFQAILRRLSRKKSRRETRSTLNDLKHGTLRRSNSAELISEIGDDSDEISPAESASRANNRSDVKSYRGLRISNTPIHNMNTVNNSINNNNIVNNSNNEKPVNVRARIRHNSDGNYDDVKFMQETILNVRKQQQPKQQQILSSQQQQQQQQQPQKIAVEESIYENLIPLYSTQLSSPNLTQEMLYKENPQLQPVKTPPIYPRKSARQQLNFGANEEKLIRPPLSSDTSSVDSHNDSGYSTRIAVSEGPSPPLLGDVPMLDPHALYMIPPDLMVNNNNNNSNLLNKSDSGYINSSVDEMEEYRASQAIINPKSSFV